MKIFVAGITGATGQLLAAELLANGHVVYGFARNVKALPSALRCHENLKVQQGSLLDVPTTALQDILNDVEGIASCLGHNLSLQGLWGQPRTLVKDATQRLVELTKHKPMRLILMSSNGVTNKAANEVLHWRDRMLIGALRKLLPPHKDNELAAAYLQNQSHPYLEWCIVRPDNLVNHTSTTEYQAFTSPQLGIITGSGQTSRINVAHFMSQLLTDDKLWGRWKNQWPVLYNSADLNHKLIALGHVKG